MLYLVLSAALCLEPAKTDDALARLINRLDRAVDPAERLGLVRAIAAQKSPRAIATLSVILAEEKSPDAIRMAALEGLVKLNLADGNDAIALAALDARSAAVRARAVEAIGTLRITEFLPACTRALQHDSPLVRRAGVEAIVQFGDWKLAQRVIPFVKDPNAGVSASARRGVALVSLHFLHLATKQFRTP